MLTVACVKWGVEYGRQYVNTLYDSVSRNLPAGFPGRFLCFTDDPTGLHEDIQTLPLPEGYVSWWNKLYLFSQSAFEPGERVLYFDLDTVVCGPLDAIAAYNGPFAILRDAYRPDGLQSSVMAWEAGKVCFWKAWQRMGCPMDSRGDQGFIEDELRHHAPALWQDLFPGRFRSYKRECRAEIPRGTSVVVFHGHPRPHEVTEGWVPQVWKVGGGSGLEFVVQANVSDETLADNVKWAKANVGRWLTKLPAHKRVAIIVGGGPSLADELWRIRGMRAAGGRIFACGNTARFLADHDIKPSSQVLLDARPENASFIQGGDTIYCASQCARETLQAAIAEDSLVCYHAAQTSYAALTADSELLVGGGSTVGLKAIAIAYLAGYRHFRLFGFDSSYREDAHHAYPQALNDGERRLEVKVGDETFSCAPWMVSQAEEFKELLGILNMEGCVTQVYGTGLIPSIVAQAAQSPSAADERAHEILKRLPSEATGVEVGVFLGELSKRLLSRPGITLHMIDPWSADCSPAYRASDDFHAALTQPAQDHAYELTQQAVQTAGARARIWRTTSLLGAAQMAAESLDFVFLDADHTLEAVRADIVAWWPKVKPGGWLGGHDYDHPEYPAWGVKQAVDERFPDRELGGNYTWFARKA